MSTDEAPSQALESLTIAPLPSNNADTPPIITQLVPVVWELISRYITGAEVISICSVLSKPMWLRFRQGISGEIVFGATDPVPRSPALYSFITHLPKITSVVLGNSSSKIWRAGPQVLDLFPPTIRSISLNLPFYLSVWLVIPPNHPLPDIDDTKLVAKKSRKVKSRLFLLTTAPSFYLQKKLPALQSLRIKAAERCVKVEGQTLNLTPHESVIKTALNNFLKGLPTSLQHLTLPKVGGETDAIMSLLPDQLESFDFLVNGSMSEATLKFPQLRRLSLDIDVYGGQSLCTKILYNLPASLEELEWLQRSLAEYSMIDLSSYSLLKSLTMRYRAYHGVQTTFPKTLTALDLATGDSPFGHFHELPRSLTSFIWHFSLANSRYGYVSDWKNLPSSLLILDLREYFVLADNEYQHLPRHLTRLSLSLSPATWPIHECQKSCEYTCRCIQNQLRYDRNPSDMVALDLPAGLRSLSILNTYFGPRFYQNLPSTLEELEIDSRALLDETTFCQLPPKLKVLTIIRAPDLNPAAWDSMSTDELLELRADSSLRCASFAKLPRTLIRLEIDDKKKIFDKHIKDLPRGLRHFYSLATETLSTRCAADLPRELFTFRVAKVLLEDPRPTRMQLLLAFPSVVPVFDLHFMTAKGRRVLLENLVSH